VRSRAGATSPSAAAPPRPTWTGRPSGPPSPPHLPQRRPGPDRPVDGHPRLLPRAGRAGRAVRQRQRRRADLQRGRGHAAGPSGPLPHGEGRRVRLRRRTARQGHRPGRPRRAAHRGGQGAAAVVPAGLRRDRRAYGGLGLCRQQPARFRELSRRGQRRGRSARRSRPAGGGLRQQRGPLLQLRVRLRPGHDDVPAGGRHGPHPGGADPGGRPRPDQARRRGRLGHRPRGRRRGELPAERPHPHGDRRLLRRRPVAASDGPGPAQPGRAGAGRAGLVPGRSSRASRFTARSTAASSSTPSRSRGTAPATSRVPGRHRPTAPPATTCCCGPPGGCTSPGTGSATRWPGSTAPSSPPGPRSPRCTSAS
jgi:hypothetical protein